MSSPRTELTAAVLGSAAAGALALSAGGQTWASVTASREPPLPPVDGVLRGSDVAPLVPATGLVLLAAAVALLAVAGAGRVLVGVLMAAAGGALTWSGVRVLTSGVDRAASSVPGLGAPSVGGVRTELSTAWPALALVAGVLGLLAGALVVVRGRRWPGMGRRYERSAAGPGAGEGARRRAARPPTDEDRAQAAWTALDRGEDPTDSPPGARGARSG